MINSALKIAIDLLKEEIYITECSLDALGPTYKLLDSEIPLWNNGVKYLTELDRELDLLEQEYNND